MNHHYLNGIRKIKQCYSKTLQLPSDVMNGHNSVGEADTVLIVPKSKCISWIF